MLNHKKQQHSLRRNTTDVMRLIIPISRDAMFLSRLLHQLKVILIRMANVSAPPQHGVLEFLHRAPRRAVLFAGLIHQTEIIAQPRGEGLGAVALHR